MCEYIDIFDRKSMNKTKTLSSLKYFREFNCIKVHSSLKKRKEKKRKEKKRKNNPRKWHLEFNCMSQKIKDKNVCLLYAVKIDGFILLLLTKIRCW